MRDSDIERMMEELRGLGFEVMMGHPDRTWRVVIWAKSPQVPATLQAAIVLHSKRDVIEFLKAVLLGFNVGKISL